jgi:antitoxin component YwqK of YwqJK toxin-antitoxin module
MIKFLKIFQSIGLATLLFCFIFACKKQSEMSEKVVVPIPNIEVLATDSSLSQQDGITFLRGKPFSGFVIEKYQNDKIASKTGYFEGKMEGKQEKWYPAGSKMEVRFYAENRKVGTHTGWWENGQKKFEYFIESDIPVGTHREWYPNGQIYSLFSYNTEGQPDGKQQMWYSSGQIKANYVMKDGRRFGFLGAKGCMGEGEKKQSGLPLASKGE